MICVRSCAIWWAKLPRAAMYGGNDRKEVEAFAISNYPSLLLIRIVSTGFTLSSWGNLGVEGMGLICSEAYWEDGACIVWARLSCDMKVGLGAGQFDNHA